MGSWDTPLRAGGKGPGQKQAEGEQSEPLPPRPCSRWDLVCGAARGDDTGKCQPRRLRSRGVRVCPDPLPTDAVTWGPLLALPAVP